MGQLINNQLSNNNKYGIDNQLWTTLKTIIYPGAKDESIKMVIDYCVSYQLDPLQKPVHIVAMYNKEAQGLRDVVLPGITLYRIQASRSGEYIGLNEPEFGPNKTIKCGSEEVIFPEWCKIVVKKAIKNDTGEFYAKEYWLENYAAQSKSVSDPNYMWKKRPFAQLAKCCEAQALRKAFPELAALGYTIEEMEGKTFDNYTLNEQANQTALSSLSSKIDKFLSASDISEAIVEAQQEEILESNYDQLKVLIDLHGIPESVINTWLEKANVEQLDQLSEDYVLKCMNYIENKYQIRE